MLIGQLLALSGKRGEGGGPSSTSSGSESVTSLRGYSRQQETPSRRQDIGAAARCCCWP